MICSRAVTSSSSDFPERMSQAKERSRRDANRERDAMSEHRRLRVAQRHGAQNSRYDLVPACHPATHHAQHRLEPDLYNTLQYSSMWKSYGKEAENRWVLSLVLNVRRHFEDVK